jgi:hypothetical protein
MGKVQAGDRFVAGPLGQFPSHEAHPTSNSASYHFAPPHRTGSFTQPLIFQRPDNDAAAHPSANPPPMHDTCGHQIIQHDPTFGQA